MAERPYYLSCDPKENPMANLLRASLPIFALALAAGCAAPAAGPESKPALDMLRGGNLYRSYCIAFHTAQVHWRDKRIVQSWDDLLFQVSRWQRIAGQDWSREEINDVAAYLNGTFYELPCPQPGCGGRNVSAKAEVTGSIRVVEGAARNNQRVMPPSTLMTAPLM